ncbi:hypothetical protein C0033_24455 [Clostridium sp. chh4-2]|nr:hypothetical protein C0033_24455 [Clostridium sp. chh4-2]
MPKKLLFFYYTKINIKGEGFSENAFTLYVKTYLLFRKIFLTQLAKHQPERRGNLGGRRN